jgi:hypothetical protein
LGVAPRAVPLPVLGVEQGEVLLVAHLRVAPGGVQAVEAEHRRRPVGAPGQQVALEHADLGRLLRQAQPRLALGQRRRPRRSASTSGTPGRAAASARARRSRATSASSSASRAVGAGCGRSAPSSADKARRSGDAAASKGPRSLSVLSSVRCISKTSEAGDQEEASWP